MPVWILICYLIVSVFVIFAIVRLYGRGEKVHAKSALTQYAAYTIIFIALYFFHLSVPSYALLLTMLTVLLSSFCGHYLGYYTRFGTFDRYLHAFGTFSFSLMIYCIINSLLETGGSKFFRALVVFLIGNTLGAVFELGEAAGDSGKKTKNQKGLKDTNFDMLCNLIGASLSGVFAYFWML